MYGSSARGCLVISCIKLHLFGGLLDVSQHPSKVATSKQVETMSLQCCVGTMCFSERGGLDRVGSFGQVASSHGRMARFGLLGSFVTCKCFPMVHSSCMPSAAVLQNGRPCTCCYSRVATGLGMMRSCGKHVYMLWESCMYLVGWSSSSKLHSQLLAAQH